MSCNAPIGILDSGFGGLSVLRAIRALLPAENLAYCADHAFLPWGERAPAEVRLRTLHLADVLVSDGAKAIVLACNTATAAAADLLRARLAVPVVGMEPAVKPAAAATRSGVIGVLGTGGTLASARFAGLLERYAGDLEIVARPSPELVTAAETEVRPHVRRALVAAALAPLLAQGADVIVLGCTHFAYLRPEIDAVAGPAVTVIDTGPAVARQVARCLWAAHALRAGDPAPVATFRTTGDPGALSPTLQRLWGAAELRRLPVEPGSAHA